MFTHHASASFEDDIDFAECFDCKYPIREIFILTARGKHKKNSMESFYGMFVCTLQKLNNFPSWWNRSDAENMHKNFEVPLGRDMLRSAMCGEYEKVFFYSPGCQGWQRVRVVLDESRIYRGDWQQLGWTRFGIGSVVLSHSSLCANESYQWRGLGIIFNLYLTSGWLDKQPRDAKKTLEANKYLKVN